MSVTLLAATLLSSFELMDPTVHWELVDGYSVKIDCPPYPGCRGFPLTLETDEGFQELVFLKKPDIADALKRVRPTRFKLENRILYYNAEQHLAYDAHDSIGTELGGRLASKLTLYRPDLTHPIEWFPGLIGIGCAPEVFSVALERLTIA